MSKKYIIVGVLTITGFVIGLGFAFFGVWWVHGSYSRDAAGLFLLILTALVSSIGGLAGFGIGMFMAGE